MAAMPFPSPQGTQASIAAMLTALTDRGDLAELLTYAHGTQNNDNLRAQQPGYRIRRLWDVPRDRSLRSGPSCKKVLLDLQLTARLALFPAPVIVAHHVEAAAACLLARRPFVFFAHTDLEHELPLYAPRLRHAWVARAGRAIDHRLIHSAQHVAAISPRLAHSIERATGHFAVYVPLPWLPRTVPTGEDRQRARTELGLGPHHEVCLYAGNLDRYQGWETLVLALAQLQDTRANVRLLVATASDPSPLRMLARDTGIADLVTVTSLNNEGARQRCHHAADLALIPRRAEGGLPIKLLDALARSVPVVATKRAIAGLPLQNCVEIVDDDSSEAIATAAAELLNNASKREQLRRAGSAYLREHHSYDKFFAAYDSVVRD